MPDSDIDHCARRGARFPWGSVSGVLCGLVVLTTSACTSSPVAAADTPSAAAAYPATPEPVSAGSLAAGRTLVGPARNNAADAIRKALAKGADPNAGTPEDGPPIVAAAGLGSWNAVEALLESPKTDVDRANPRGETALMLAAMRGEMDIARKLIARGAEVNRPGWTPLHYAAAGGQLDMVKFLVEENAYLDAQSPNDTTPLMMAARQKFPSIAEYLVAQGADPTLRNQAGFTAADYFVRNQDEAHAKWLREQAARFEARYGTQDRPRFIGPAPVIEPLRELPAPADAPGVKP